jgi:DNA repair protein RadD
MQETWNVGPYELRIHQRRAVEQLRMSIYALKRANKKQRVILQGVCGFGKTVVSSYLAQQCISKGGRFAFVAHGRVLIFQKSDKLADCEMQHGVLMADAYKYVTAPYASQMAVDGESDIYVISKDTYQSWLKQELREPIEVNLVVVDECHASMSNEWMALLESFGDVPIIGLSGTPALGNGKGLGNFYNDIVIAATHEQLINDGFLVPCRYFKGIAADVRGLDINYESGEYNSVQVDQLFHQSELVGDFLTAWHEYGHGRQTAFYASSVAHSVTMTKAFQEGDGTLACPGVPWEHVDADTPQDERRRIYNALASGAINGVSNFAVLRVGFDCPVISCIQLGVAMHSLVAFLQSVGRGFRPHAGKEDCIVIDHGQNLSRHMWPQKDRQWSLDVRETIIDRERDNGDRDLANKEKTCRKCDCTYPAKLKVCPQCGNTIWKRGEWVRTADGTFEEVKPQNEQKKEPVSENQRFWSKTLAQLAYRNLPYKNAAAIFHKKTQQWPEESGVRPIASREDRNTLVRKLYPYFIRKKKT